jgi:hypothetical protein
VSFAATTLCIASQRAIPISTRSGNFCIHPRILMPCVTVTVRRLCRKYCRRQQREAFGYRTKTGVILCAVMKHSWQFSIVKEIRRLSHCIASNKIAVLCYIELEFLISYGRGGAWSCSEACIHTYYTKHHPYTL